jgi:hypothetical protein
MASKRRYQRKCGLGESDLSALEVILKVFAANPGDKPEWATPLWPVEPATVIQCLKAQEDSRASSPALLLRREVGDGKARTALPDVVVSLVRECLDGKSCEGYKVYVLMVEPANANHRLCLRFETAHSDQGSGTHDYCHAQFQSKPPANWGSAIEWTDLSPAFPVPATGPVTLLLATMKSIYGASYRVALKGQGLEDQMDILDLK